MSSALDLREDCSLEALFPRIANPSASNKITVMGHRGGFKPDNSMASFQRALDSSCVQIVELDVSDIFVELCFQVWLTKDGELLVVHGGDSGEVNFGDTNTDLTQKSYIFDLTLEQNRKLETEFVLPTLREVFQLLQRKVCINIEVKVPYDASVRAKYDWLRAIQALNSLINSFALNQHSFVSSFNWDALREMERISSATDPHPIRTIYLTNFYNHIGLPSEDEMLKMGDGLNIQFEHVTSKVVELLH